MSPLRILNIEDDPVDSQLIAELLTGDGLDVQIDRVDTMEELEVALASVEYSLILSDYSMPGMDPFEALALARRTLGDVPFIFVSGTLGEERAVETLKRGATDYVLKQRLDRLVPSVRRAIQELCELRLRKRTEEALRESEERYRTLFDSIDEGFCIIEVIFDEQESPVDHRFLETNPAFERQTGLVGAQGKRMRELAPDHEQGWLEMCWRVALTGEPARYQSRAGELDRWYDVHAFPFGHAEARQVAALFNDITERKRAYAALQAANEALREEGRRKSEFLAVLSHELRNPLAPIRNSVYILERAAPGGEQATRARQVIDRQAQHMTRLIDDLLDVTRIARGKVSLLRERVDLDALVRGTAEDHREQYSRNGIEMDVEGAGQPLWVNGDRTRLAQVFGNLLNNSAKFTPRGGRTVLSVEANEQGEAVVRVRDDGAGMSPETLERLFEPFSQGAQTIDRTRGGLGLGLALVKGLVEMHGGKVTAHSEGEGKGSELTVTLPMESSVRPGLAAMPATKRSSRARRVLVIEDNVDAAESLREALELGHHEVAVASSGHEGVAVAREYRPDVVLCDIGLPGLDGYGVARALRTDPDPKLRSIFLVALSGYALQEDVTKSEDAGFDRHMAKPPSIEALEDLLRDAPDRATARPEPGGIRPA